MDRWHPNTKQLRHLLLSQPERLVLKRHLNPNVTVGSRVEQNLGLALRVAHSLSLLYQVMRRGWRWKAVRLEIEPGQRSSSLLAGYALYATHERSDVRTSQGEQKERDTIPKPIGLEEG